MGTLRCCYQLQPVGLLRFPSLCSVHRIEHQLLATSGGRRMRRCRSFEPVMARAVSHAVMEDTSTSSTDKRGRPRNVGRVSACSMREQKWGLIPEGGFDILC
eukprot:s5598_g2.t1